MLRQHSLRLYLYGLIILFFPQELFASTTHAIFRGEVRSSITKDELRRRYPKSNGQFLRKAIRNQDLEGIALIMKDQPEISTDQSHALLTMAIREYHEDISLELLSQGLQGKYESAAFLACSLGKDRVLKMLLGKVGHVNIRDASGNTLLHYAARYGHESLVSLLLEYGADDQLLDINGLTAKQRSLLSKQYKASLILS
jgi:ankyrin repeat protein